MFSRVDLKISPVGISRILFFISVNLSVWKHTCTHTHTHTHTHIQIHTQTGMYSIYAKYYFASLFVSI
jgi:hypothetical protein